jgi:hypothetical protein
MAHIVAFWLQYVNKTFGVKPLECHTKGPIVANAAVVQRRFTLLNRVSFGKFNFGVPTLWDSAEGNIGYIAIARYIRTLRGRRPCACTETPYTGTGRSHNRLQNGSLRSALGTPRGHARDIRMWEVGQPHITKEAPNNGHGAP